MKTAMITRIALAAMVVLGLCGYAWAGELLVPSQYTTIQAAIDAAVNGDEVIVADGTYTGIGNKNLDFGGKAITVRSENGTQYTTIDCQNDGRGFYFHTGEDENSIVAGFTITNGLADLGAGILCDVSNPTIDNCIFKSNTATILGGGIHAGASSPVITNCSFEENRAGEQAGGMCLSNSNALISGCIFIGNVCDNFSADGGAMLIAGDTSATIVNCLYVGNSAYESGGAIRIDRSSPSIINCTFNGNSTMIGGAIHNAPYASPIITNCIFWGNDASTGDEIDNNGDCHPTVSHCDIEGGWNGPKVTNRSGSSVINGGGNIASSPLFIDAVNPDLHARDYHLSIGSACINAGDNSALPVEATTDLGGNPRIIDDVVDIGAYEAESYRPVAHWKFDEGTGSIAYDSAGTNDGTIYGAAWATGILDGALNFDGVGDYIDVGNDSSLKTTGDLTIIAWIKARESRACIYSHTWNGWRLGFGIGNNNYDGRLGFYTWNHGQWIKAGSSLADDTWHHAAVTLSGTTVTLYTDGIEIGSDTGAPASDLTGIGLIGLYNYDWHFGGLLDDLRIYNRALSALEIEELYNSAPVPPAAKTYYVDGVNGSDLNDGESRETAFATIQMGIDTATDGNSVLVYPAVYDEALLINNKAIKLQGVATSAGIPIVQKAGDYAVSYYVVEGPDNLLKNFVLRGSDLGIFIVGGAPTISNVTIVDNLFGIAAYAVTAQPDISNCIFWNNTDGDLFGDPEPLEARYSFVEEEVNEPTIAGLVSHWELDEGSGTTAYDSAGTNDGIIYGNPSWTTGKIGRALNFDAVDDYIDMSDGFADFQNGLTLSLWVFPTRLDSWRRLIDFGNGEYNDNICFTLGYGSNAEFNVIQGSSSDMEVTAEDVVELNKWQYFTATLDGSGNVILYKNGAQVTTGTSLVPRNITRVNNYIGKSNWTGGFYYQGQMDDVRIYDRALSAEEIGRLYQPAAAGGPLFADDYHLRSERGRHWPEHDVWVLDKVTSPCVDGGDPAVEPWNEPMPNGRRINMGAYGDTAYASMSEWPLKYDGNFDGIVNMLDLAGLAQEWLQGEVLPFPPPPPPPTLPGQASNPNPADGATSVSTTMDLSWTAGVDAVSHDVYFGVTNPPGFRGNVISPMFGPGSLSYETTYYWRIDEVNSSGIKVGEVWSFTTLPPAPPPPPPPPT